MIVVTHVLTEYTNAHINNAAQLETLYWIRMLVIFGTPGFLMLTQLIFTLNLQGLPDNYLRRRLQYVFIPYIVMGAFFFEANTVLFGWIGYYFVGSYLGSHYERLKAYFEDYGLFFIGITVLAFILFVMTGDHNFTDVTSNNEYIMLYCISAFFYIIHFSIKVQGMLLEAVTLISTYSFFIYLFHPIILQYVYAYTERFEGSTLLFMLFSVLLTFGACIGVGIPLRTFSIFKYVMGTQPYR